MRGKFTFKMVPGQIVSLLLSILFPAIAVAADFTVIANRSVPVNSLTKEDIKAIYLGKKSKWDDGSPIKFYLIRSPKSQKSFLEAHVGKTPDQYESYWLQNVFTGKGAMPEMLENSEEMIQAVKKTGGSIGFVSGEANDVNIKKMNVE